ncbi:unnamed protein product [Schistosoma rodhaini]|uniref:EF-hand domain-containing protein n=1 Tax=Schistosoma rodhaini TaxID=6188 RepID=A0AA85FY01_9TREM|nr:unnamed protein product [Schistosoma rodhaini]
MAFNFHDMSDIQCVDQKSSGSDSSSTGEEERLRQLFLSCDSNNDGCLDCEDLYNMCKKLNMAECAEEIINTLGANTKGCITFDEFLSCREKVFQMQTEADNIYFAKSGLSNHQIYKPSGLSWCGHTTDKIHARVQNNGQEVNENSVRKMNENINLESSASETSLVNSGAEYDSGAQDLCGEPQSLYLLMQRDFPDLYKIIFPLPMNSIRNEFENDTMTNEFNLLSVNDKDNSAKDLQNQKLTNTINIQSVNKLSNLPRHIDKESFCIKSKEIESNHFLDNVRHLFECANTLHVQRTAQLRSEIRDLSHRLQGLQTSRDMNHREVQRLQREKEQLRNELTNQVSRYEDRLTELHSVIAELRRRLEHTESNIIHEVEEFEENDGDDGDDDDGEVNDNNVMTNYKSDRKSKLSLLNTFNSTNINHDYSTHQDEFDKDMSGNSDTSVNVMMDDDDEDDGDDDNVEDVVGPSSDAIEDKYVGIIKQYHQSKSNSNLQYDPLNHNHELVRLHNENNNNNNVNTDGVSNKYNHDLCIKYETIISNMQAQLTYVIEERDMLANQLNELTGTHKSILLNSTIQTSTVVTENVSSSLAVSTTTTPTTSTISEIVGLKSYSISHPIMGLNRSVQMRSNSNNNNVSYPPITSLSTPSSTTGFSISKQQTNVDNNITNQLHKTTSSEHLNHNKVSGTITKSSVTTSVTNTTMTTQMNSNVYDLPEPEWITQTLKQYYEYSITHSKPNIPCGLFSGELHSSTTTTTATNGGGGGTGDLRGSGGVTGVLPFDFEQSLFDQLGCEEISTNLSENSMNLSNQFTPNALMIFLCSLAHSTPYPRLSELAHCAQLTSYRLLTKLAHYQSDCLVLQANLAEIKSNADQMQCQLNQIESNWSIINRAMQYCEAALEVSDCLNQLYSTELAVTIFRQSQNNQMLKHPFSTISSSTSSSSFHGHNKPSQLRHQPLKKYENSQQISVTTSPYQLYSSIGSSEEHDLLNNITNTNNNNTTAGVGQQQQQQIFSMNHFNLHNLKSLRQQVELLAYTILDKYETSDGGYEKILPTSLPNLTNINMTTTTSVEGTIPTIHGTNLCPLQCLQNVQHSSQSPISPGLCSIQSAITSSSSLLDNNNNNNTTTNHNNNSIYANSWYVSLNRNKFNPAQCLPIEMNEHSNQSQQLPSMSLHSTSSSIPSVIYQQQQRQYNNNVRLNHNLQLINPHLRSFVKSNSQSNTNQTINESRMNGSIDGCGWETPDSGAGSSSINELSSHQRQQSGYLLNPSLFLSSSTSSLLFGHYYQTYGEIIQNNTTHKGNNPLDLLVVNTLLDNLPPLWTLFTKTSTSFYESDLDSSDSSDLPGNFMKTTDLSKHTTPSHHHPHNQQQQQHHPQQQQQHNSSIHGQLLPQLPPISSQQQQQQQPNSHSIQLSNWSRLEERKLRIIYYQLIHHYKRLQSMLIDMPNPYQLVIPNNTTTNNNSSNNVLETSLMNEIGEKPKTTNHVINHHPNILTSRSITVNPIQQQQIHLDQQNSISMNSLRKLPLAVFLENSILLQELCCIKEECADLKIRVYLLEKELHSNRLTLDSRAVAERALRAHLDALIIEQNNQQSIFNHNHSIVTEFNKTTPTINQSIQNVNHNEIVLLRGQVKNLLQALEALRSSTEIQQIQSEELVNDLKRANSALIKAFNKVKHKYTTRIKKLENQLHSIQPIPSIDSNSLPLNKPFRPQTNSSTIIQTATTTTTTTSTTSTTHNDHLSNTFKGCIIEHHDLNNVSINSHIHSIYPIKSSFQQSTITTTTTTLNHSLNIPTMIDSNRDFIPSIPTSYIPSIPLNPNPHPHHHHLDHHQDHLYPQTQQQLMKSNTSKVKTTPSQHLTNVKQFLTH